MTAKNTTATEKEKAPAAPKSAAAKKPQIGQWPVNINEFVKQSLEYNRKGFETVLDAVETFQGKAEEYTDKALEKTAYIPAEGKAQVKRWFEAGRKARTGFREAVIKGHEQLEQWLTAA